MTNAIFIYCVTKHNCLWATDTLISQQSNKPVQFLQLHLLFYLLHRKTQIKTIWTHVNDFYILSKVQEFLLSRLKQQLEYLKNREEYGITKFTTKTKQKEH